MFLRAISIATLGLMMFVSVASAQTVPGVPGGVTQLTPEEIAQLALLNRLSGRSRTSRNIMGPAQLMQQQQMMQQQMVIQQEYANAQADAAKRAERKAKLKESVQQQREKDAARAEARKEKALAEAAAAEAKKLEKTTVLP